jgi:hypothetical protein
MVVATAELSAIVLAATQVTVVVVAVTHVTIVVVVTTQVVAMVVAAMTQVVVVAVVSPNRKIQSLPRQTQCPACAIGHDSQRSFQVSIHHSF